MQANVQIDETRKQIETAVSVYGLGVVAMDAAWRRNLYNMATREYTKAWFPWTKAYWQRRLDNPEILWEKNRTYYNSPLYHYWMEREHEKALAMARKYDVAKRNCQAHEIILSDDELQLLVGVPTAEKIAKEA